MARIRPTKNMMLAVNAAIEGDKKEVDRLIKEHDLDAGELDERLVIRNGRKYEFKQRKPAGRRSAASDAKRTAGRGTPNLNSLDLNVTIDGRTSVAKLYKLIEAADRMRIAAQRELKRRPDEQVEPVKKAMAEIELLRREREKVEQKLREAEDALT